MATMRAGPLIGSDVSCKSCGYNRRGLTMDLNCPECGEPACHSVRFTLPTPHPETENRDAARTALADGFRTAAASVGQHASTLRLAYAAFRYTAMSRPGAHLTARDVCAGLRDYATYHFGGEANATQALEEHGLRTSEDYGRVVFALVSSGVIGPSAGDKETDFAGLFSLENLYLAER